MSETYSKLLLENKRSKYYIETTGRIYRVAKQGSNSYDIVPRLIYRDSNDKKGTLFIITNVDGIKRVAVHTLMAKCFLRGYDSKKHCIGHKDGNPKNCNLDNLYIYSRSKHGKAGLVSNSKAVIVANGSIRNEYRSVREAAKALYCSYQTLLDYLSGTSGCRSSLSGLDIYFSDETLEEAVKRRNKGIRKRHKRG